MESEEIFLYSVLIAALFLESDLFPRQIHPRSAQPIVNCVVGSGGSLSEIIRSLDRKGFWEAKMRLELPGIVDWSQENVSNGQAITLLQDTYPHILRRKLGSCAPPVLWLSNTLPPPPYISVLPDREGSQDESFAYQVGAEIARVGGCVLSQGSDLTETSVEKGASIAGGSRLRTYSAREEFFRSLPHTCQIAAPGLAAHRLCSLMSERCLILGMPSELGRGREDLKESLRLRDSNFYVRCNLGETWWGRFAALGAIPLEAPSQLVQGF